MNSRLAASWFEIPSGYYRNHPVIGLKAIDDAETWFEQDAPAVRA